MSDPVNPNHYKRGDIECIDAMKASMSDEAFKGALKANIIKYVWRYEMKKGLQWYMNRLILEEQNKTIQDDDWQRV